MQQCPVLSLLVLLLLLLLRYNASWMSLTCTGSRGTSATLATPRARTRTSTELLEQVPAVLASTAPAGVSGSPSTTTRDSGNAIATAAVNQALDLPKSRFFGEEPPAVIAAEQELSTGTNQQQHHYHRHHHHHHQASALGSGVG